MENDFLNRLIVSRIFQTILICEFNGLVMSEYQGEHTNVDMNKAVFKLSGRSIMIVSLYHCVPIRLSVCC